MREVVPRCFEQDDAYVFQDLDKRIIFAIPYEDRFTMIGTTDSEFSGDPGKPRIGADEVAYLCDEASSYFKHPVTPADVVWSFNGVRPLFGEPQCPDADIQRFIEAVRSRYAWLDPELAHRLSRA